MEEDEQGEEKKMTRMNFSGRNDMTREGTHVYQDNRLLTLRSANRYYSMHFFDIPLHRFVLSFCSAVSSTFPQLEQSTLHPKSQGESHLCYSRGY